jgi:hypothetical protein
VARWDAMPCDACERTRLSLLAIPPDQPHLVGWRARTDMALLAHIREQYNLSFGSYGRPRMTAELKQVGLDVGAIMLGAAVLAD